MSTALYRSKFTFIQDLLQTYITDGQSELYHKRNILRICRIPATIPVHPQTDGPIPTDRKSELH